MGGAYGDPPALVVVVSEPAVDGRANEAVVRALAKALGVPRSGIEIVSGHAARTKVMRIADPSGDLDVRWHQLLEGGP